MKKKRKKEFKKTLAQYLREAIEEARRTLPFPEFVSAMNKLSQELHGKPLLEGINTPADVVKEMFEACREMESMMIQSAMEDLRLLQFKVDQISDRFVAKAVGWFMGGTLLSQTGTEIIQIDPDKEIAPVLWLAKEINEEVKRQAERLNIRPPEENIEESFRGFAEELYQDQDERIPPTARWKKVDLKDSIVWLCEKIRQERVRLLES